MSADHPHLHLAPGRYRAHPFWRFTVLTVMGCLPWVLALTLAGCAVGDNWESLQHKLHYLDSALVLAIVGAIFYLVVRQWRRTRAAGLASDG
jgi:membrane protein DedA with SNARE-associated domain